MKFVALTLLAVALVSCNRDPNYRKKMYLESGNTYFKRAKYKEASIFYRRALAQDPKFGPAYYQLALTNLKLVQVANAVPYLRRAVELLPAGTPDWADANLKLGEILLYASTLQDAPAKTKETLRAEVEQTSEKLLKLNPNGYAAHRLAAQVARVQAVGFIEKKDVEGAKKRLQESVVEFRRTLQIKPGDPDTTMDLARVLTSYGEIAEAEQLYRNVIDKDKTAITAYMGLYSLDIAQRKIGPGEEVLKKAIANNPKNYDLQIILATHYFRTGNRPQMKTVLDNLKTHYKEYDSAYLKAGEFYFKTNDGDEAIRQYQEGIAKDPKRRLDYQKRIIEVLMMQGKSPQAYEKVTELLKEFPKDIETRGLRANFLLNKGEINEAASELQSVVTAKPDNVVARFYLARAYAARNDFELARQQLDEAIKQRPDYMPARFLSTQIQLMMGNNEAALKNATEMQRYYPNSGAAKLLQSAAMMRLGRYDESRALLNGLLSQNPKQPEALLEMGVLELLLKKYKESGEYFRRGYEADPASLRGLLGQAETYLYLRQPDQAIKLIENESQKFPTRVDLKRELGKIEMKTGQYDRALVQFQGLLDKVKDSPRQRGEVYKQIGETYALKGDLPHSIDAFKKAKELMPDNIMVLNDLALVLDSSGMHKDALQMYQLTIRADPHNAVALNNLAYLMAETGGDLNEALTLANRAKQQLPNLYEVSDTIGWIYLKKNLSDNAVEIFRDLVLKVPDNSTYHYHYAMALLQKGDKEQARKECQAALERKPKKEEQDRIHDLMSKMA